MSPEERLLMVILTGLTNFLGVPTLYVLHKKDLTVPLFIGYYTLLCSFMYHILESLEVESCYLGQVTWHKLDNVGSITFLCTLMVYFMDNLYKDSSGALHSPHTVALDLKLQLLSLFLVLTMQANDPWRLINAFFPVLLFASIALIKHFAILRSRLNKSYLQVGLGVLGVSVICFIKGLGEDYLRIWHGLWHCGVAFSNFYLWQAVDKDREDKGHHLASRSSQERFRFVTVIAALLGVRTSGQHSQLHI